MGAMTLIVRVLVGALFIFAGVAKVGHFNDLAAAIAGFRILPEPVVGPLAVLLPFFEIGLGLYLAAGLFTRTAATIAAVQLTVYAAAIASAVIRHIPANCGCFGPQDQVPADWPHVVVDLALAAVCVLVARRAPGLFALDTRLRSAP
ncbi:MAG TPA: MauE/DoxX family redox-associated membrane protein [Candidatus Baltobacteraceae bacterium]|nr:MauE/DoxX family redox-associated membrane protein [Candidatus Baltobacteraceae bacterium]